MSEEKSKLPGLGSFLSTKRKVEVEDTTLFTDVDRIITGYDTIFGEGEKLYKLANRLVDHPVPAIQQWRNRVNSYLLDNNNLVRPDSEINWESLRRDSQLTDEERAALEKHYTVRRQKACVLSFVWIFACVIAANFANDYSSDSRTEHNAFISLGSIGGLSVLIAILFAVKDSGNKKLALSTINEFNGVLTPAVEFKSLASPPPGSIPEHNNP